jgi:hypothetical protein
MRFVLSLFIFSSLAFSQSWPTSVVTNSTIPFAMDHSATTLTASITSSSSTISVASSSSFSSYEVVNIDSEQIQVCSVSTGILNVCPSGRGYFGTTAASHSNGANVFGYVNAGYHNTQFNELQSVESWLNNPTSFPSTTAIGNFLQSGSGAVARSVTSKLKDTVSINDFGADPTGATDSTAAIQQAINSTPSGGRLYIPVGTYKVCTGLPLTITQSVTIWGAGWSGSNSSIGSVLQVCSSLSSSTDVIKIEPASGSDLQGMRFQDFAISPQSGTPGRYGIDIDGTNGQALAYFVLDHFHIGPALGNYAIAVTNLTGSAAVTGSPYIFNITNASSIVGGVYCNLCGDTMTWVNSDFVGPRDVYINLINASGGPANTFTFSGNSETNAGGLVILGCDNCVFTGNEFEQDFTSTNADNAMIDIRGISTSPIENLTFTNNEINPQATPLYPVYINYAKRTNLRTNRIGQSNISPNYAVEITANANKTYLDYNETIPDGNPIGGSFGWLNDNGVATFVSWIDPNTGFDTHNTGIGSIWQSITGGNGFAITSSGPRANPTNGTYCWTSGVVSSSSCDTGISRLVAGIIAVGNGTFGDTSGKLIANQFRTTGVHAGTFTGAMALGAGDMITWPNAAATSGLSLAVDSSDRLTYPTTSNPLIDSGGFIILGNTASASNCNQSGTLSSVTICLEVKNTSGTIHYIPVF